MAKYKVVECVKEGCKDYEVGKIYLFNFRTGLYSHHMGMEYLREINSWNEILEKVDDDILHKILFKNEYINVLESLVERQQITIKNRIFKEEFSFENLEKLRKIREVIFLNCTFETDLYLENLELIKLIDFRDKCKINSALIILSSLEELHITDSFVNIIYSQNNKNISIQSFCASSSKIKAVKLSNYNLNFCYFTIDRSSEVELMQLSRSNFKHIKNQESTFEIASNSKVGILEMDGISSEGEFIISDNKNIKSLTISNSNFNQFEIKNNKVGNFIIKENCTFSNKVNFISNNIKKLEIKDNTFEKRLKISTKDNLSNQEREVQSIDSLIINTNTLNDVRIGHTNFENLELRNLRNENEVEINIGSIQVSNDLIIKNFRNKGEFKFYDLNNSTIKANKLHFSHSSFGNAEFLELNFKSFKIAEIYSCNLIHVETIDVDWFDNITISDNNVKNKYEKIRNAYRTLKLSMLKQEDKIQALKFHSLELTTHFKNTLKKCYKKPLETITLFFSSLSLFGSNWLIPLILILILNILFTLSLNIEESLFNIFLLSIELSFPLSSVYSIIEIKEAPLLNVLDLLRRLFVSILIYQIVVAFRKFSRKI